jgi:hypothetical protein
MITDASPFLAQRVTPIVERMFQRIEGELEDRDRLALETAVIQAAISGVREGIAHVAHALVGEGIYLDVGYYSPEDRDPDPWAEVFGYD